METTAKTLGESYEGCLSRDWEKLLTILESGGKRVVNYRVYESEWAGIMYCEDSHGQTWYWGLSNSKHQPQDRESLLEWLEANGIGWFPTKEDEL